MKTNFAHLSNFRDRNFPGITIEGESMTHQSEYDDTDVNRIMERFQRDGRLPNNVRAPGSFMDVSETLPYDEALNFVREANKSFLELPSAIRNDYNNDPALFVQAVQNGDPDLNKKLEKFGLAKFPERSATDLLKEVAENTKIKVAKPREQTDT